MSKKLSRNDALEDISTWSTNDVLCLLRKNGLEECCKAITKRRVDGDELLHLTEGKLALWKADLTRPLIWSLWTFVEDVKKSPEKYVDQKIVELQVNEDRLSDIGSWGTDFEDETNDENVSQDTKKVVKLNDSKSERIVLPECMENHGTEMETIGAAKEEDEATYANCGSIISDNGVYANFQEPKSSPLKNTSRLHGQVEKSLAEQLKEQLKLMNVRKPIPSSKPERFSRNMEVTPAERTQPQKSFLHNISMTKPSIPSQKQKRMSVPPPPEPKIQKHPMIIAKSNKDQPKPPATIRNLDLVANLPTRTDESEDEYEAFDEQIIEQNQRKNISKVDSKQSLTSGYQSSVESVYQPPSITSHDEEEEQYEIYESITETREDNDYYLSPIQRTTKEAPLPLPPKPSHSTTPPPILYRPKPEKPQERSPEKKSATLPHSSSNTTLSTERATRPLPPPPDRHSYVEKPWFHNVTREQAMILITDQSTYGNPQDGRFLLRPSTMNINNPLTLVVWYKDRVYNIPVRKRPDNRYALGSVKVNERSFSSVEDIVMFHSKEELVLYSGGMQTGSTRLTDTPSK